MQWKSILRLAVSAAALGTSGNAKAQTAGITGHTDITGLPTPNIGAGFFDLSGDGTTIAGVVRNDATTMSAFRITTSGYQALSGLSGHVYVLANGVSDDGSVIVGTSQATYSSRGSAMIWEGVTGTALAHLATTTAFQNSGANGVSGDGTVAVGFSVTNSAASHAVRWVNKGNAEDLNGGGFSGSFAQRASRNGSVIVGYGSNSTRTNEGFVWTQAGGMTGLGVLSSQSSDTGAYSRATDISADGAVTQAFLPLLRRSEAARIVNVSSLLASLTTHSDPVSYAYSAKFKSLPAYSASKCALNAWTVHLAYVRLALVENEQRIRQAARSIKRYLQSMGVNVPMHGVSDRLAEPKLPCAARSRGMKSGDLSEEEAA